MRFAFAVLTSLTSLAVLAPLACATAPKKPAAAVDPLPLIEAQEQQRAAPAAFAPYLASPDAPVRARAVLAVARLEMLSALDPLERALADPDPAVRANAAFGLGQLDLAIDPAVSSEEAARKGAEHALAAALAKETDAKVRSSILRALGRVADGAGLDALIALAAASTSTPAASLADRADALLALGVSGKRRQASRAGDPGLLAAASAALVDDKGVAALSESAAYAVLNQKLRVGADVAAAGLAKDAQARIFLARAAPFQDDAVAQQILAAALKDPDWRVRVEALRGSASRQKSLGAIEEVLDEATAALLSGKGAEAHVVRTACTAIADSGAGPADAKDALEKAYVTLAKTPSNRAAACACAVALDIVAPGTKAVERCNVDASDADVDRLRVRVIAGGRISQIEKVQQLAPFLQSDDVKTRMVAADALTSLDTREAAAAAAARLVDESDYGVASTLLEQGPLADNPDALPDSTLLKLAQRFQSGTSFEQVEPLVTVATLARKRTTPSARSLLAQLQGSAAPRVRDAANGVPPGERAPGPRAKVVMPLAAGQLPLYANVKTSRGDIKIAFDRDAAPSTVTTFVALANSGFYAGTPFHRVIADFVAQGGDKRGDGAGGPGYTIDCENSDETYTEGAVGIATSGKDTGGSQFFFTHSWQPHLDGRYTLFARVVAGMDVMEALQPGDTIKGVDFASAVPVR